MVNKQTVSVIVIMRITTKNVSIRGKGWQVNENISSYLDLVFNDHVTDIVTGFSFLHTCKHFHKYTPKSDNQVQFSTDLVNG